MTKSEQINQILHKHIRIQFKDAVNYKALINDLLELNKKQILPTENELYSKISKITKTTAAKEFLLIIGFDDAHLPELFNNDDKSYYKITELMEEYHQAKLKLLGISNVSALLSDSLGECVEGNDYEIVADKDGRFWINHKEVGSGEPLTQWIDSVLNVR